MNTGEYILAFLISSLFIFAAWDILAFKTGKTTASRIVINLSKRKKSYAVLALLFSIGVIFVGIWLVFHWESPCVLFDKFCWVNV